MARGAVRVVFRVLAVGPDKVAELAGNGRKYVGVVGARLQVGTLGGAGIYAAGYTVLLNDEGADYATVLTALTCRARNSPSLWLMCTSPSARIRVPIMMLLAIPSQRAWMSVMRAG